MVLLINCSDSECGKALTNSCYAMQYLSSMYIEYAGLINNTYSLVIGKLASSPMEGSLTKLNILSKTINRHCEKCNNFAIDIVEYTRKINERHDQLHLKAFWLPDDL